MMKLIYNLLGLLLSSQLLLAQDSNQSPDKALLWKIEGHGIQNPSFLFGTIHMIPKEDYFLPNGLEQAFDHVKKVFFEIDIDKMNDPMAMLGLMDKIVMKNDTSLTDLLSPEEYGKMKDYFDHMGLPLAMFDRVKPMFLSAMAGTDGNPMALQDGSFKSYEFELSEMAKQKHIQTDGLETMEFQLSIFDSIPYGVQAKMLVESISSSAENEDEMKKMYQNYKEQNLNALNQTISKEDQQLLPYLEMILYHRNKNWIPIIKSQIEKESCFFAVGAGHLGGEKGVINLLRKEGYTLIPVISDK
jgi:uncharacterized protein YbaP (TraB family)